MSASTRPVYLAALLEKLDQRADQTAILAMEREGARSVSGRELATEARRLAHGLPQHGLSPGDRVGLIAESSPALIAALLGIVAARCVAVPLDAQLEKETLQQVWQDCGAKRLLTTQARADRMAEQLGDAVEQIYLLDREEEHDRDDGSDDQPNYPSWQALWSDEEPNDQQDRLTASGDEADSDQTAVLFYTSGTTGAPKGVPLSHKNLLTQLETISHAGLTRPDDRVLLPLPLHHVYPLVIGVLTPIHLGLPIILPRSLTGPDILNSLREGEATFLIGVPRLFRALHDAILSQTERAVGKHGRGMVRRMVSSSAFFRKRLRFRFGGLLFRSLHRRIGPKLRVLASGGSPLDPELAWRLEGLGWRVAIGYGLTETSPLLTINPPGAGHLDTVGPPIEEVELKIDRNWRQQWTNDGDHDGEAQREQTEEAAEGSSAAEPTEDSDNQVGEILARGPSVFTGYWNLPDKTSAAFTEDGWFRTGDLGYLDRHHRLHVSGRVSTLIITEQGEKVQPDEVESVYAEAPEIREIGVLQSENRLVGLAVPETTAIDSSDEREQLIRKAVDRMRDRLPSYKQIADVVLTQTALPRTRIGKIRRQQLKARFEQAKQGEPVRKGPISRDEMSAEDRSLLDHPAVDKLWDLLADQFSDQPLTPDSHLRGDLGIDSMRWLNITMEIMQTTGVELDDETLAEVDTVRDLLEAVERASGGEGQGDLLDDPESVLNDHQLKRLQPLGRLGAWTAHQGFGLNRKWVRWFFKLQVEGLENLPSKGPLVVIANHLSHLDPFVLSASFDRQRLDQTYWAAWVEATRRNPLTRWASRLAKTIPIDPQRGVISSLAFGAAVLERDGILVWFPEGQRSRDGQLHDFRPGLGMLLQRYPVPVVPAVIEGTYQAMPPGSHRLRRHPVRIRYGQPLDPQTLMPTGDGDNKDRAADRIVKGLQRSIEELAANGN